MKNWLLKKLLEINDGEQITYVLKVIRHNILGDTLTHPDPTITVLESMLYSHTIFRSCKGWMYSCALWEPLKVTQASKSHVPQFLEASEATE